MNADIEAHQRLVTQAAEQIELFKSIADRIIMGFESGAKLYIFGNGGSAADAQHIAAELVGRFKEDRRALPAVALTTDTSIITAVSNDIGAEQVFSRQVQALVTPHDMVWAISVSGTSPNVIQGIEAATRIGAYRIGFTGSKGTTLQERCDTCYMVDHDTSDRVQELHQLAYHLICDRIEQNYL